MDLPCYLCDSFFLQIQDIIHFAASDSDFAIFCLIILFPICLILSMSYTLLGLYCAKRRALRAWKDIASGLIFMHVYYLKRSARLRWGQSSSRSSLLGIYRVKRRVQRAWKDIVSGLIVMHVYYLKRFARLHSSSSCKAHV